MNTDDVTSDWFVFSDESERISQKLVSLSASRQMLSPVGVELVEDG